MNLDDQALDLMKARRFAEALPLLRRSIDEKPSGWNAWYLAGQCCSFLDDLDGAIEYLSHAAQLQQNEPAVFLGLGVALQLHTRWDEACAAFGRAINIDPDYALAYNSLALTQRLRGELDKALHNYEAGVMALARRIVKAMSNKRSNPIWKHRDTAGTLWTEYAVYGALYLVSCDDVIGGIAVPTSEQAHEEEQTEQHGGLYWTDMPDGNNETVRLFLPNYFNTFRELLRRDSIYSNLLGNRGTVLGLLGREEDARHHHDEATEFFPEELANQRMEPTRSGL